MVKGLTITKANLEEEGVPCVNYGEVHSKYGFRVNPEIHPLKCVDKQYLNSSPSALLERGDMVFADTSEDLDGAGNFTQSVGNQTLFAGYHTIIAKPYPTNSSDFLAYAIDSTEFRTQVRLAVKGVKVYSITQAILRNTDLWLPPFAEQSQIADFLDYETAKIDLLIEKQSVLIDLLKEKRQAVISHAVTKGLNPDAPMKDSGLEWLGEVPEHWRLKATKRLFTLVAESAPANNNYELLSIYTAIGVRPRRDLEAKGNKATTTDGYWVVRKGDLIVNKLLAWMGAIGVSEFDGVTSPAYDILRQRIPLVPQFYDYLFRCGICLPEFRRWSRGIMDMRLRLYFEELGRLVMPYPSEAEQSEIVTYLKNKLRRFDTLIVDARRAIDLLKERRAALISAAVTGKIDVRDWKAPESDSTETDE